MLPRRFMVRSVLEALRSNHTLADLELLSTRIVDHIEMAGKIFEADDDAAPMPISRADNLRQMPLTPEDLGQDDTARRAPRAVENLPQPPALVIAPDSEEARATWQKHEVRPIRPGRSLREAERNLGELPNWNFDELFSEINGKMPTSIDITPEGTTAIVTLDRTFQSNPATGIVKVLYTLSGQRDTVPSAPSVGGEPQAALAIPIDVSKSFSIFSAPSIDFDAALLDLKHAAVKSFRPRAGSIVSTTPRTGGSLDGIYRNAMRNQGQPNSDPPETGTWANATIDLSR